MSDQKREWRLAYARGYNTASAGRWPLHQPPIPPDETVGKVVKALIALADAVRGECAKFDAEDPMAIWLLGFVDEADDALEAVGRFCLAVPHLPAAPESPT